MAALDLPIVARTSTLHCSGGSLRAVSLNQSYLSHLKLDQPETCCIRFKNIKNVGLTPSILPFLLENC